MTTASDSFTTVEGDEVAAHGDLLASVICDLDGELLFGSDAPAYIRGTLKQDTTQFEEIRDIWLDILDTIRAIATGQGITTVTTLTGAWTPGGNGLVFARVEDQSVRFGFPTTGLVPIALSDFPGFGGAGDPYDILPVGHRPATGVTFTRDLVSVDRATDVDPAVRATAFVPILFIVGTDGGIYIISTDDDVVGLTLNAGLIKADVTFPLTIS